MDRGDIGYAPLRDCGQERVIELLHIDRPQHQPRVVAELTLSGRHAEIESAIHDVGATEPNIAMAITHAQKRHRGQVSAGRLTAYRQDVGVELSLAVLHQPGSGGLAIVRTRRIRMFRCQTIFHGDDGLTRVVGNPFKYRILHIRTAKHPTATVEMQANSVRLRRRDHTHGYFVAVLPRNERARARFDITGAGNGPSPRRRAARMASAPTIHHSG